ncbi:MAG TPA: hypothetical protein VLB84_16590 [Bacteroidia bacterium]|nr:hypothetical protein [Bacteroidia bacterium]
MAKKGASDKYEIPDKPEDVHTLRDLIGFVIKNSDYPEIIDALREIYRIDDDDKKKKVMSKEAYHQYIKGYTVGDKVQRKLELRLKELGWDVDYSPTGTVKINKIGKLKINDSTNVSQSEDISIKNVMNKSDSSSLIIYEKILELDTRVSKIERKLNTK